MQTPVWLAVDLGTTHTVAVIGRAGQEPRSLLFDGSPLLPSGVFLDAEGGLHTGRDAQRLAASDPERFEPHPKRRIDDGTVLLGDKEIAVDELLATGLRRVAEEASASGLEPAETVLTYPADWGPVRRATLERAAARAGLGNVRLLAEPIAAAAYCADVLGQEIPPGGTVAIFDFGGGTFDIAVVRREDDPTGRLRTLAVGGLDDLGGLDVDMALAAHLGRVVAAKDTALWKRLFEPETTADRRDRLAFWGEVRAAKEMLSRTSTAPVALPGHNPMGLHLTRDELQSLADPLVARAVDETRRTIERAGVVPAALTALLLVGGSSRMPLVATRLHARLGVAPSVPEQPELPVAYGALRFAVSEQTDLAASTPPATPPAGSPPAATPPAVSGPPAEASGTLPPGESRVVYAPYPVGGMPPHAAGLPSPAQFPGASPTPVTPQPPYQPAVHTGPLPVGRRRSPRAGVIASSIALAAAVALVFGITRIDWDGLLGIDAESLLDGVQSVGDDGPELVHLYEHQLGAGAASVIAADGMAVFAEVAEGATTAHAVSAEGDTLWTRSYELEPTELHLTVVEALLVIDAAASATNEGQDMRAAVSLETGDLLWTSPWNDRNDIAFYGTDVIVEQRDGFDDNAVIRIDLATGEEVWKERGPDDLFVIDEYRIRAAAVWDEGEGGSGMLPPDSHTLFDNLAVNGQLVDLDPDEGTGVVRDAADGSVAVSGDIPVESRVWTVFDGLVIGRANDEVSPGRDTLVALSLADLGEVWRVELDVSYSIEQIKACGPQLVCAALDHSSDNDQYQTIALDTRDGAQRWEVPVEWAVDDSWYTVPSGLVFGDQPFDEVYSARILDFDGAVVAEETPLTSVLAVREDRAVVQGSGIDGFHVAVLDIATGATTAEQPAGADLPEHASFAGDLLVVLTGDKRVMLYTVPDLT